MEETDGNKESFFFLSIERIDSKASVTTRNRGGYINPCQLVLKRSNISKAIHLMIMPKIASCLKGTDLIPSPHSGTHH